MNVYAVRQIAATITGIVIVLASMVIMMMLLLMLVVHAICFIVLL